MIKREHYLDLVRGFYETDLIKIITGIRRAGKSVILMQIMEELEKQKKKTLYLNFEDTRTLGATPDAESLIEFVSKKAKEMADGGAGTTDDDTTDAGATDGGVTDDGTTGGAGVGSSAVGSEKLYLFFDEIQEVDGWQMACRTLRLDGHSLFITGSNSKLLSKEYTKEFSGRYVSFVVQPFTYKEILEYTAELGVECSVDDYLVWGGFPKRFEFYDDAKARETYLEDLNRSIVENDLIVRYKIQNTELFRRIVNYVLKSNARVFSSRSIEAYLKNEHVDGSINTIIKYLGYLEEAYVIRRVNPHSAKTKTELQYYFKVYDADVSLNSIRVFDGRYDLTHNLENIIYNELIYMGYKLEVYNDENGEIDFVAMQDGKKYYIQVAYSVADEKAYEREFGVLNAMDNDAKKILITHDAIDYTTSVVKHVRLEEFLKMQSLEET